VNASSVLVRLPALLGNLTLPLVQLMMYFITPRLTLPHLEPPNAYSVTLGDYSAHACKDEHTTLVPIFFFSQAT
jgi:hypothetical protein